MTPLVHRDETSVLRQQSFIWRWRREWIKESNGKMWLIGWPFTLTLMPRWPSAWRHVIENDEVCKAMYNWTLKQLELWRYSVHNTIWPDLRNRVCSITLVTVRMSSTCFNHREYMFLFSHGPTLTNKGTSPATSSHMKERTAELLVLLTPRQISTHIAVSFESLWINAPGTPLAWTELN